MDEDAKPGVVYRPAAAEPHVPKAEVGTNQPMSAPVASSEPLQPPIGEQSPNSPSFTPSQATEPANEPQAQPQSTYEDLDEEPEDDDQEEHDDAEAATAETTLKSWNAPEFTFTNKPVGWYALLALFFIAMIGLAIFTKQYLTIGLLVLMCVALVIYAQRKPRTLNYTITTHGVYVGEKSYHFDSFSSFYEISDYGQRVFELVPSKQFGTLVSLPIQVGEERSIEDLLGSVLPKVPPRNDLIDRLLRAMRF